MQKISAFIITCNEQERIAKAIESLIPLVAEIVVVDSGSTDKTAEIAQAYPEVKFLHHEWSGYGEQKKYAEQQCAHEWLLNIDADERLSKKLCSVITEMQHSGFQADAYRMPIREQYFFEHRPARWSYAYWQIRLYNRTKGCFNPSTVHDVVDMQEQAKVKKLQPMIIHESFRSLSFALNKFNNYSDMQVEDMCGRKKHFPSWRLWVEFPISFIKSYVLRRNFLYGRWGFILSMNYAASRFLRAAKFDERKLHSSPLPATSDVYRNN